MRIGAEDVVEAAFAVLDEHGLDGLTTRKLSDRLGVAVGAIYWHVRSKRELLGILADRIVAEAVASRSPVDAAVGWDVCLAGGARAMRRAMLAHRDGARLVAAHAPVGVTAMRTAEAGLTELTERGVPLELAAHAGDTVMSYVTGFVMQEQMVRTDPGETVAAELGELPLLARWASVRPGKDAAFERGLNIVVAGVRAELGRP